MLAHKRIPRMFFVLLFLPLLIVLGKKKIVCPFTIKRGANKASLSNATFSMDATAGKEGHLGTSTDHLRLSGTPNGHKVLELELEFEFELEFELELEYWPIYFRLRNASRCLSISSTSCEFSRDRRPPIPSRARLTICQTTMVGWCCFRKDTSSDWNKSIHTHAGCRRDRASRRPASIVQGLRRW